MPILYGVVNKVYPGGRLIIKQDIHPFISKTDRL